MKTARILVPAFVLLAGLAAASLLAMPAYASEHPAVKAASTTEAATPLKKGIAAYASEDYQTALKLLQPLADAGNSDAQNKLGTLYYYGQGVKQDYEAAYFWWLLSDETFSYSDATFEHIEADSIGKNLTPEQKIAVEKRVKEWTPTSARSAATPIKPSPN